MKNAFRINVSSSKTPISARLESVSQKRPRARSEVHVAGTGKCVTGELAEGASGSFSVLIIRIVQATCYFAHNRFVVAMIECPKSVNESAAPVSSLDTVKAQELT